MRLTTLYYTVSSKRGSCTVSCKLLQCQLPTPTQSHKDEDNIDISFDDIAVNTPVYIKVDASERSTYQVCVFRYV